MGKLKPFTTRTPYVDLLRRLLPLGPFYNVVAKAGHPFEVFLHVGAAELARFRNRILQAVDEMHPRTASETIGAWEEMLGIGGDDCLDVPTDIEDRQALAASRLTSKCGNSTYDFLRVLEPLGATDLVIERTYKALVPGTIYSSVPRPVCSPYAYHWTFRITGVPVENQDNALCLLKQVVPGGVIISTIHS